MAYKFSGISKAIAGTNPNLTANSSFVNAVFQNAYGRNATAAELKKFTGQKVSAVGSGVYGTQYQTVLNQIKPTTGGTTGGTSGPVEDITTKINNAINTQTPGWKTDAYKTYLRDYGIRVPAIESELGITDQTIQGWGIDLSKSAYGLSTTQTEAQRAMGVQNFNVDTERNNLNLKQLQDQWDILRQKIGSGELDPTGQEFKDVHQQLQEMTDAALAKKQELSARGSYFGGARQRELGNAVIDPQTGAVISGTVGKALNPYIQNIQSLHSSYGTQRATGQSEYDVAMGTYLGNKKSNVVSAGMDQGAGSGTGFEYGGGKWNPATQQFENIQYGLNPQQAQSQGLEFFGTNPYDLLIAQEQKKQQLQSTGETGMQTYIGNAQTDLINRLKGY